MEKKWQSEYCKYCKNCKYWKKTSDIEEPNPSGKCNFYDHPHEGWGIHAHQLACRDFKKK